MVGKNSRVAGAGYITIVQENMARYQAYAIRTGPGPWEWEWEWKAMRT